MESTIFPAIATVTAAFIAGGVAFLSVVLSKEQKTSEFRNAWLNSVLEDVAKFTGAAESISEAAWLHFRTEGKEKVQAFLAEAEPQIREALAAYYRARIRLYPDEHKQLHEALENLQILLIKGIPEPAKVRPLIREIVRVSHDALKAEWKRVKTGEKAFQLTKNISLWVFLTSVVMIVGFAVYKAVGH